MKIVRSIAEQRELPPAGTGFVPTMGAFHEGHLTLMREARKRHERVVVSLFVNPLQFGPNEDLSRYPRQEEADFAMAEREGVDVMFCPDPGEVYPRASTFVRVPEVTDKWEGASRPGHFDGVATIVTKLFNIVRPEAAYFGWKDLQQCLVIRRMVEDLNQPLILRFLDTVREQDGLALSSRNAYLSPEDRAKAPHLYGTLQAIREEIGERRNFDEAIARGRSALERIGFSVDYLEVVRMSDLAPLRGPGEAAIIVAARLGATRLIDNMRFAIS